MGFENLAENFNKYFDVCYANSDALLKQVYKIRYDVFCEELKLEEGCPKDIEMDEFDKHSIHFLLRHKDSGQYAGTVRFVIPSETINRPSIPLEKYCLHAINPEVIDFTKASSGHYGEVSRLAVPARFRKRAGEAGKPYIVAPDSSAKSDERRLFPYISVGLYLACAALFQQKQLDYAFVMTEPRLARALARIGICFSQAGDVIDYHGQRAPFYITQEMLQKGLKQEISPLFKLIKNQVLVQTSGSKSIHQKAS